MVKVFEDRFQVGHQGIKTPGMYIDGNLKSNLDVLKEAIKHDWDGLIVVDGAEGSGKSVLAQQVAYYCDPTLDLNRIIFRPDNFRQAVLEAKQYQAVVYDEAFGGLSSRKTMSDTNFAIVQMLTEVRAKNLFLIIVLPTFFDLDKYVSLWRSRCLLHVYADKFKRGFFQFFSYKKKKDLYVVGKKFYNYKAAKADFYGRFTNFYPCGPEEYKKKKLDSLRQHAIESPKKHKLTIEKQERMIIARHMYYEQKLMKLTKQQVADLMGVTRVTMYKYLENDV